MANLIERQLAGVRRRVRVLTAAYGTGRVLAAASAAAVATVALDYLLDLPSVPRVVLLAAAASAVAATIVAKLGRPLTTRLSLTEVVLVAVDAADPLFWILIRPSLADWLVTWLLDAALELLTEVPA